MRTTITLNEELVARAGELMGTTEKSRLVTLGLEALIAQESARRLARLGGSDRQAQSAPRHRLGDQA